MTALSLYKFIKDHNIEYHWINNDTDVIIFVHILALTAFNNILPKLMFETDGIECRMKDNYLAFRMEEICDYCEIDMKEVFDNTP